MKINKFNKRISVVCRKLEHLADNLVMIDEDLLDEAESIERVVHILRKKSANLKKQTHEEEILLN